MKFESHVGKMVFVKGKFLTFKSTDYETDCENEIKALKGAKGVKLVKAKK